MTRRCKNKCGESIPKVKECDNFTQRKGYCCSKCEQEHEASKRKDFEIKKEAKPKAKKKGFKSVKVPAADTAFSLCIRTAAKFTCERCGSTDRQMQCSHIYPRANRTVRWAKDNAMCKCSVCHMWWHANPTESGIWFRNLVGEGFYDLLTERKNNKVRVSKLEEKDIAAHYRAELKKLEAGATDFESWQ